MLACYWRNDPPTLYFFFHEPSNAVTSGNFKLWLLGHHAVVKKFRLSIQQRLASRLLLLEKIIIINQTLIWKQFLSAFQTVWYFSLQYIRHCKKKNAFFDHLLIVCKNRDGRFQTIWMFSFYPQLGSYTDSMMAVSEHFRVKKKNNWYLIICRSTHLLLSVDLAFPRTEHSGMLLTQYTYSAETSHTFTWVIFFSTVLQCILWPFTPSRSPHAPRVIMQGVGVLS